jgi:hypothetical protein
VRTLDFVGRFACLAVASLIWLPSVAHAGGGSAAPAVLSVDVVVTKQGSGYDWTYNIAVTNAGPPNYGIAGAILIPEIAAGYLSVAEGAALPEGWQAATVTSPPFGDPFIKPDITPGAWFLLNLVNPEYDSQFALGQNNSTEPVAFDLFSPYGGAVNAHISAAYYSNLGYGNVTTTTDPITPNVPEPATWAMLIIGVLGLFALRRPKRATASSASLAA